MEDGHIYCSCGETYVSNLAACPNCGEPNSFAPSKSRAGTKIVATVGIIVSILAAVVLLPELIPLNQTSPLEVAVTILQPQQVSPVTVPKEELVQRALETINGDRAEFGLPAVKLSDNQAAQVHAEDVFATKQISHWLSNGEKPYMTYTRLGGSGSVHQNVAISGFSQAEYDRCVTSYLLCERVDPLAAIEELEYEMMYNDLECCNDGHRKNILNPYHTHVSIGIVYDDYYLALVQNFENNHELKVQIEGTQVTIEGSMPWGTQLEHIMVYYDPLPTPDVYEENRTMLAYGAGELVASVFEPLPPGFYYQQSGNHAVIEASNWENDGQMHAMFDIAPAIREPGVYTLYAMFKTGTELSPATSYSIFVAEVG